MYKLFTIACSLFMFLPACAQQVQEMNSVARTIVDVPGYPDFAATEGDDCWILNEDRVEKFAGRDGSKLMTVRVPGACGAMIAGNGVLWVASCLGGDVYKIDTHKGVILAKVHTGISDPDGEIMLALGDGFLWVPSDSAGLITKIDIRTSRVVSNIKVGKGTHCASFFDHGVWVTNTTNSSLQRIDARTDAVSKPISTGPVPRFLAADGSGVWTLNQGDGSVSQIDPKTGKLVRMLEAKVPGSGGDIAVGAGKVWVRAKNGFFLQVIDQVTGLTERIYTPLSGSGAVRVSRTHVWVTAHDVHKLWILDP